MNTHKNLLKLVLFITILLIKNTLFAYTSNIVLEVDVKGNKNVIKDIILLKNRVSIGQKVGTDKFKKSLEESIQKIYNLGYFSDVRPVIQNVKRGKKVVYYVEENTIISEIKVHGNNIISDEKVLENLKTRQGRVFNFVVFRDDVKKIRENYEKAGYIAFVSDVKYHGRGRSIDIYVTEATLDKVKIIGNTLTKDNVIRREVLLKPGQYFDINKIRRTNEKLISLGYFADDEGVVISQEPGSEPGKLNLVIKVKEGLTGSATFGGGYSSRDGIVGYVQVVKGNFGWNKKFTGEGQTIKVKTRFGGVKTYEFSFIEPFFLGKPISIGFDLYHTRRTFIDYDNNNDEFEIKRRGGAITLGKRFNENLNAQIRYKTEVVDSTRSGDINGLTQTLSTFVNHDTRDNIRRPKKGLFDSFLFELSGLEPFHGPRSYTKVKSTFRRFYPFEKNNNVLAMRFEGGIIDQFKGPELPWYEKFLMGGIDTVRGYETEEFYGRKVVMANFELRHELTSNLDLVIFQDFGRLWKKVNGSTTQQQWLAGKGIGIHFLTPIGPIRLFFSKAKGRDEIVPNFDIGTNF